MKRTIFLKTFAIIIGFSFSHFIGNVNQSIFENYTIQSTYVSNLTLGNQCNILKLNVSNENIELCLVFYEINGIINNHSKIIISKKNASKSFAFGDLDVHLVKGYMLTKEGYSFIKGYVNKDRYFGKIRIKNKVYYVEPMSKFESIYEKHKSEYSAEDAVIYEDGENDESVGLNNYHMSPLVGDFKFQLSQYDKSYGRLCPILVAVDNSFFRKVGLGSLNTTTKIILLNLDETNAILRSTDFDDDGIPDNIGIIIDKIIFISSDAPDIGSIVKVSINQLIDPKHLLQSFSSLPLLQDVCLGILLTAQPFINNYLGVSFTPRKSILSRNKAGICVQMNRYRQPMNSLLVTYRMDDGKLLPSKMIELNLAHEIMHSFGSDHDSGECLAGHIMSPRTYMPSNLSNYMFSKCTRRDVSFVLRNQGYCLIPADEPFCGNGLVEENEDCDCGSSYVCALIDPCCNPRNAKNACRINRKAGHQCHPSQGLCCTSNCRYKKDVEEFGANCAVFENKCPCGKPPCPCGVSGICVNDECHSMECTRIGLKECSCRKKNDNVCRTCCSMPDGKCLNSQDATGEIIDKLNDFDYKVHAVEVAKKHQILNEFCTKNKCFNLAFAIYRSGEYCIANGELGKCLGSACIVAKVRGNIYPIFKRSIAVTFHSISTFIYVLLFVRIIFFLLFVGNLWIRLD